MFKRRWTKWMPLGNYNSRYVDYVVMAKRNKRTGMLKFKVKRVTRYLDNVNILPLSMINVQKAWQELTTGGDDDNSTNNKEKV